MLTETIDRYDVPESLADPLHPDWNDSSDNSTGVFGLPFTEQNASVIIVPVPWEAACSQGRGTSRAPELVLEQSRYVELHDHRLGNIYERGISMIPVHPSVQHLIKSTGINETQNLNTDKNHDKIVLAEQKTSNVLDSLCQQLNVLVELDVTDRLSQGKNVCLLGGDHSVSYGSIAAHQKMFPDLGILQIDAHADLRPSLDGLWWSHASVIRHVMDELEPVSLTQVGIRAVCSVEQAYQASHPAIHVFSDAAVQWQLASTHSWMSICDRIIDTLPADVYLTLDIDGLDPSYCLHTGTPVPGGLSYMQVVILMHRLVESGRCIRGFDLVEVGGHPTDALIAAHLLYILCGLVENRLSK